MLVSIGPAPQSIVYCRYIYVVINMNAIAMNVVELLFIGIFDSYDKG